MKKIRLLYLLPLAMFAFALNSCINDDLADCPPTTNVTLLFRYSYDSPKDIFAQHVGNVDVNVFDMQGGFVTSLRCNEPQLAVLQGVRLKLKPGTYRVVCWGNVFDHSQITRGNLFSEFLMLHTDRSTSLSDSDDPLFYAPRINDVGNPDADIFTITVPAEGAVEKTIDFTSAHNTVEVFVTGFSDGIKTCPQIEMTNLVSAYDFSMQPSTDSLMTYRQTTGRTETRATTYAVTTFYTALFQQDNNIDIHITRPSTGALLYTINLKQYLADNSITLHSTDCDYIPILVEFNDLGVVAKVTPWDKISVTPEN